MANRIADEVKWIKIVVDIFNDEKILLIESMPDSDAIIVIWFKLLTLAGKSNAGGLLMLSDRIAYTDEMLATVFRRPLNTVRMALQTFEQLGMIEITDNEAYLISNWEKHQNVEGLEKIREQNRIRQANRRARIKAEEALPEPEEESRDMSRDVTPQNKNKSKNKNKNKNTNNALSEAELETEFEELWKLYPRKRDKAKAKKSYVSARKKGATYEQVETGIRAYKTEIERKHKDLEYIKYGSTWFAGHCWEDEYTAAGTASTRTAEEEAALERIFG